MSKKRSKVRKKAKINLKKKRRKEFPPVVIGTSEDKNPKIIPPKLLSVGGKEVKQEKNNV